MSDLTYTPTFEHTDWIDNVDRVEAGGPSGLNARLHAIESDLRQASTVVDRINVELGQVAAPPPQTQRLAFVPLFLAGPNATVNWNFDPTGNTVVASSATEQNQAGVVNVPVPDHVRLTAFRVRGTKSDSENSPVDSLQITFFRVPARLSATTTTNEQIVGLALSGSFDTIDSTLAIPADKAVVDLANFRYLVLVSFNSGSVTSAQLVIRAFEFDYQSL